MAASAADVVDAIAELADPERAAGTSAFFKTGPGQYGEGDVFVGVSMPKQRTVVKQFRDLALPQVKKLLRSDIHEHRMVGLLILVDQYKRGDDARRQTIHDLYLAHTACINNWDLVDATAEHIVGEHTYPDLAPLLVLAESADLWERRIAMVSCFADIKRGDPDRPLAIAEVLAYDDHDLIQKAVGWMLREVGKRIDRKLLVQWLRDDDRRYRRIPRTELRYALEHFPKDEYQAYLAGTA